VAHEDESTDSGDDGPARAGSLRACGSGPERHDDDAAATSTATPCPEDDDDHAAALPRKGGPDLIAPLAGALLLGSGVLAGLVALRRNL